MRRISRLSMHKITTVLFVAVLVLIAACGRSSLDELDEERFGRIEGVEEFFEITWVMEEQEEGEDEVSSWFRQIVEQRFNVSIVPVNLEISGPSLAISSKPLWSRGSFQTAGC
jgi:hypothetical protein